MWAHQTQVSSTSNAAWQVWVSGNDRRRTAEDGEGTSGVRVPRRPIQPFNSPGDALDLPGVADPIPPFLHVI